MKGEKTKGASFVGSEKNTNDKDEITVQRTKSVRKSFNSSNPSNSTNQNNSTNFINPHALNERTKRYCQFFLRPELG